MKFQRRKYTHNTDRRIFWEDVANENGLIAIVIVVLEEQLEN